MTDRLAELFYNQQRFDDHDSDLETIDLESRSHFEEDENDLQLAKFSKSANRLSGTIDRMYENIETLRGRYQVSMDKNVHSHDRNIASSNISFLVEQTNKEKKSIQKKLIQMAGENLEFAQWKSNHPAQFRIRVTRLADLTRKFSDAISLLDNVHENHRDIVRKALQKNLQQVNPDATEEDIHLSLRMGKMDEIVHKSKAIEQINVQEKKQLLKEYDMLQSKNNDIMKLASHMNELSALFHELQVLIHTQKELLNGVEYVQEEAREIIKDEIDDFIKASPDSGRSDAFRKKKWLIVTLLLVVLLASGIPVLVKYVPMWLRNTDTNASNLDVKKKSGKSHRELSERRQIIPEEPQNLKSRDSPFPVHEALHKPLEAVSAIDIEKLLYSRDVFTSTRIGYEKEGLNM